MAQRKSNVKVPVKGKKQTPMKAREKILSRFGVWLQATPSGKVDNSGNLFFIGHFKRVSSENMH